MVFRRDASAALFEKAGDLQVEADRGPAAFGSYSKAISSSRSSAALSRLHEKQGHIHYREKDFHQAISEYLTALSYTRVGPNIRKAEIYESISSAYMGQYRAQAARGKGDGRSLLNSAAVLESAAAFIEKANPEKAELFASRARQLKEEAAGREETGQRPAG